MSQGASNALPRGNAVWNTSPTAFPHLEEPSKENAVVNKSRRPLHVVMLSLAILILLCASAHMGSLLTLLFPIASVIGGFYLFRKNTSLYLSYSIWMWFLCAFIRRLADYSSGYHATSLIILAPTLISLICVTELLKKRSAVWEPRALIFLLPLIATFYGVLLGCLFNPLNTTLTAGVRWAVPLIFGLFCYLSKEEELAQEFRRTIIFAAFVAGAYGLYQFIAPPGWDCYWLTNVSVGQISPSFGKPEPLGVRVFGTLFSPGLQAASMAFGLLFMFRQRFSVQLIAIPTMLISLLLTMIRTAWLGLLVGFIYLLIKATPKRRLQMIVGVGVCFFLLPLMISAIAPDDMKISSRLSTFTDMKHDASAQSRMSAMRHAVEMIEQYPFGRGLGYLDSDAYLRSRMAARDEVAGHDLGPLELFIEMGLLGGAIYILGGVLFVYWLLHDFRNIKGSTNVVFAAACLSLLAYIPTSNALIYFDGFLFWTTGALLLRNVSQKSHRPYESQILVATPTLH